MKYIFYIGFICAIVLVLKAGTGDNILSDIRNIRPKQIKVAGFRLNSEQKVEIEAVGFRRSRKKKMMFTRAWILDAHSRAVVWQLRDANIERKRRRVVEFVDQITLPKGDYEVYYSTFPFYLKKRWQNFSGLVDEIIDDIFDNNPEHELQHAYKREWERFQIVVKGNGTRFDAGQVAELRKTFLQDAFVSMTALGDGVNKHQYFELTKATDIDIYALGEARGEGTFDYGWIMNLETREKIWQFNFHDSEHAGGAKKNRMIRETISLPPGKYAVFFVTDDSHSSNCWNAAPPNDPSFWGVTLKPAQPSHSRFVKMIDYAENQEKNIVLQITRLRNNEFRSKPIVCKKDLNLRIYAMGEGDQGEMYDYSWIVDSNTHETIWEMDYRNTEHAGGGDKNRLFDRIIRLNKGHYIVYYISDDSHSYWDWNTGPPFDQENWGITIYAASDNYKPGDVEEYDQQKNDKVLAQITGVGDDERLREHFTLNENNEIRIYAIGEGTRGEMFDYGWIENTDTRSVVWEMTYRKTRHAGGSEKNRMVDDRIMLKRGDYILYFESDDSHSFEEWNQSPPHDPINWGITLYRVED